MKISNILKYISIILVKILKISVKISKDENLENY